MHLKIAFNMPTLCNLWQKLDCGSQKGKQNIDSVVNSNKVFIMHVRVSFRKIGIVFIAYNTRITAANHGYSFFFFGKSLLCLKIS